MIARFRLLDLSSSNCVTIFSSQDRLCLLFFYCCCFLFVCFWVFLVCFCYVFWVYFFWFFFTCQTQELNVINRACLWSASGDGFHVKPVTTEAELKGIASLAWRIDPTGKAALRNEAVYLDTAQLCCVLFKLPLASLWERLSVGQSVGPCHVCQNIGN